MKSKKRKILIIIITLIIIVLGGIVAYKIMNPEAKLLELVSEDNPLVVGMNNKNQPKIYNGNDRPIAVMIDNHQDAWPQAGLNKAYMIYEIVVEGGETRLMALFKGTDVAKIGPVRSSRHYFLDYAMENDAIYAHFGWSPQAESDIGTYNINNINGITESSTIFWRVNDKKAPHNAVTSTKALLESAKTKNYRTTSTQKSILNYDTKDVNLEDGQDAINIVIPHSTLQTVNYKYDTQTKKYKRYARNKAQTDWETKEQVETKNIIITFCDNYDLKDVENKGRQGLYNIGTFDGYYITNGKAKKIKCTKNKREEKTVYKDLNGKEIKVNDGNTFVNICPKNAKVLIMEK